MLSFFQLDILDEIWDLIESVSEGFLTYSSETNGSKKCLRDLAYFTCLIFIIGILTTDKMQMLPHILLSF